MNAPTRISRTRAYKMIEATPLKSYSLLKPNSQEMRRLLTVHVKRNRTEGMASLAQHLL